MTHCKSAPLHAVHKLYQYRKSLSTKPFAARGKKLVRCPQCLLGQQFCTCNLRQYLNSNVSFMLIMYDDEVLKPTNSGRLIADLIPNTHAFLWNRTQPDENMLALIADEKYQPYIVFPEQYQEAGQEVVTQVNANGDLAKTPLFILLDGSWREAIKMYRKSSYLHNIPMLSFSPELLATYALRKGSHEFQLATAEVASLVLTAANEPLNAVALNKWFDLFVESSLLGRNRRAKETLLPISDFEEAYLHAVKAAKQAN
ncbi:tRNA-uridine aminocarboxypropyltransferase [Shewanella gaetbuli]